MGREDWLCSFGTSCGRFWPVCGSEFQRSLVEGYIRQLVRDMYSCVMFFCTTIYFRGQDFTTRTVCDGRTR